MAEDVSKSVTSTVGKALNTVVEPINARLSNPLLGSFAISFVLLNWKPILFLIFDSNPMLEKFSSIEKLFYGNEYWNWGMYLFIPLTISIAYVLLLPRLENLFESCNLKPYEIKVKRLHNLKISEFSNLKEYAEKQSEIEHVKANYMEIQELNQRIEFLVKQVAERNSQIEDYKNQTETHLQQILELQEVNQHIQRKALNEKQTIINAFLEIYHDNKISNDIKSRILNVSRKFGIDIPEIDDIKQNNTKKNIQRFKYHLEILIDVPASEIESKIHDILFDYGIKYEMISTDSGKIVIAFSSELMNETILQQELQKLEGVFRVSLWSK